MEEQSTPLDQYLEENPIQTSSFCQVPIYSFDHVLSPLTSTMTFRTSLAQLLVDG